MIIMVMNVIANLQLKKVNFGFQSSNPPAKVTYGFQASNPAVKVTFGLQASSPAALLQLRIFVVAKRQDFFFHFSVTNLELRLAVTTTVSLYPVRSKIGKMRSAVFLF